jgi:hypothetical protein
MAKKIIYLVSTAFIVLCSQITFSTVYKQTTVPFDPCILNHTFPETANNVTVYTPITEKAYFRSERALFSYYPRFQPSYTSFGLDGTPYLKYGSYIIQTRNSQGQWQYQDIGPVIDNYIKNTLGYADYSFDNQGFSDEVTVRFDKDGDAYIAFDIATFLASGSSGPNLTLLLHSHDQMATWTVYRLPLGYTFVRFEKLDWNNTDCLNRPPVLLLSTYLYPYPWSSIYIIVPEKQADGTLKIPTSPLKIADYGVAFGCHSGDGNQAITHGNQVFIVYAMDKNWPTIPNLTSQPQYNTVYSYYGGNTGYCRNGEPSFARVYDVNAKTLSDPVFLGWGGHVIDEHNWPTITMDTNGYLHVILNGHDEPFFYTKSLQPYSITGGWTAPVIVSDGDTYATLNCDRNNTLYAVTRCCRRGYYFEIALLRKKSNESSFEAEKYLRTPYTAYYRNWISKMSVDTTTNRLFLTYYSQSNAVQLMLNDYNAYINIWRDREKGYVIALNGVLPTSTNYVTSYFGVPTEMCTLISSNGGDTWHLAVTNDFPVPAQ